MHKKLPDTLEHAERQSSEFNEVFADPVAAKEMMAPSVERVQALLEQAGY
jgi:hypothetical protein